jgi:hypothetical protein
MKFGGFKIGKSKEKEIPQEGVVAEATEEAIPEIPLDAEPIKPHPPLQELSLDTPEGGGNGDTVAAEEADLPADEAGQPIKIVEIQVDPAVTAPPPTPVVSSPPPALKKDAGTKEADPMDLSSSISNIFENVDDEENPLANLIKVLPDVAATELLDDLKEINDIIKDWQKK